MDKGTYEIRVTPSNQKELYSEDYSVYVSSGGGGGFLVLLAGGAAAGAYVLLQPDDPPLTDPLPSPPLPTDNN